MNHFAAIGLLFLGLIAGGVSYVLYTEENSTGGAVALGLICLALLFLGMRRLMTRRGIR